MSEQILMGAKSALETERDALRAQLAEAQRERDEALRRHEEAVMPFVPDAKRMGTLNAIAHLGAEAERLREAETKLDRAIQGLERAGWPCRLEELGDAYKALGAEVERLREALRGLLSCLDGYEHHPDLCSRTHECDEPDEDGCSYCGSDACPVCECGLVQTQAAMSVARAALAGAPSETRRERDRALAERVREACKVAAVKYAPKERSWHDGEQSIGQFDGAEMAQQAIEELDLTPLLDAPAPDVTRLVELARRVVVEHGKGSVALSVLARELENFK